MSIGFAGKLLWLEVILTMHKALHETYLSIAVESAPFNKETSNEWTGTDFDKQRPCKR